MAEELGEEETAEIPAHRKGGGKVIQIKAVVKEASLEGGRLGRVIPPSVERVHLGALSRDECSSLPPSAPITLLEACHSPIKEWGPAESAESKKT